MRGAQMLMAPAGQSLLDQIRRHPGTQGPGALRSRRTRPWRRLSVGGRRLAYACVRHATPMRVAGQATKAHPQAFKADRLPHEI